MKPVTQIGLLLPMLFPYVFALTIHWPEGVSRNKRSMTYHPKSEFMAVMMQRGFLADCTDYQGLDDALSRGVTPAYIGFDATAKSLHVGSLIQIMMLRWLQKTGTSSPSPSWAAAQQRWAIRHFAPMNALC